MIPLISGMLSSLLMGGIRGILSGGQGGGGVASIPMSVTGVPIGRPPAPQPVYLGGYSPYMATFADGGKAKKPSLADYLAITGGGSLGEINDPNVKGKSAGGSGRVGVNIPALGGTLHGGVSGDLSWYDVNTPYGNFSGLDPAFSGFDVGFSKDGRDYGASYSETPKQSGGKDRAFMLNYAMPFAAGGIMDLPPIPPGETPEMSYAMDRGGMIRGAGSGVQDLVQGSIDNRQKVLLSDGEFVVPARVVSALGDGSSEAGAKVLHGMLDRVKEEAAKKLKDNGEINLNKVLPA